MPEQVEDAKNAQAFDRIFCVCCDRLMCAYGGDIYANNSQHAERGASHRRPHVMGTSADNARVSSCMPAALQRLPKLVKITPHEICVTCLMRAICSSCGACAQASLLAQSREVADELPS